MNTFLPFSDFKYSALVLDRQRLGKQRVEAYQLLLGQWPNHPASKMWRGYESALASYGYTICVEWIRRGYKDSLLPKFESYMQKHFELPWWLGNYRFHLGQRSNLLRKYPEHYYRFFNDCDSTLPYFWPIEKES